MALAKNHHDLGACVASHLFVRATLQAQNAVKACSSCYGFLDFTFGGGQDMKGIGTMRALEI
jgi:hypothetical protein